MPMNRTAEAVARQREAYYRRISTQHLTPLWEVLHALVPEHPQPACVPVMWRFDDLRAPVTEAGKLISAEEATRRVLILENPAFRGQSRITSTLYAGIQLLPAGFRGRIYRSTDATVYVGVEGRGRTLVGTQSFEWGPRDIFVVPELGPGAPRNGRGSRAVQLLGSRGPGTARAMA